MRAWTLAASASGAGGGDAPARCDFGEHQVDERVEIVGARFGGLVLVAGLRRLAVPVVERGELLGLVVLAATRRRARCTPGTIATSFCRAMSRPRTTVAVVWAARVLAPAAEPAPAAVGELHLGQAVDAGLHHLVQLGLVEHGIAVEPLPLRGALGVVADFLGVEVGALLLDRLQIDAHLAAACCCVMHRRQEAVERLLGAAVGVVGQVGQGVDHRPGERRRVADFQPRSARAAAPRAR